MKSIGVAIAVVVLLSASACAMGLPALKGHHQIGISVGMWNQTTSTRTEAGIGGVETTVGTSGGMGGVSYAYWFNDDLALRVDVAGMLTDIETDAGVDGVESKTGSITRILIGAKKIWVMSDSSPRFRPFLSAMIGPFIGNQSETHAGLTVVSESRTETAVGGALAGGTDIRIGSRFMAIASVGYNLMSDFNHSIGGSRNYSGPEFSFGLGVVLGRM